MGRELPARAERYLHAVAKQLRALSSTDRDTVLLELRSHLIDQLARGDADIDAALSALGSPADLAAAFEPDRGAGLVPVPQAFAVPWRPMRVREVLLEVRATYLASRDGLMMVGLVLTAVFTATAFPMWTNLRLSGPSIGIGAAFTLFVIAGVFASCAAYRILLSDAREPWRPTPSTVRYGAATTIVDMINGGGTIAITIAVTGFAAAAGATPTIVQIAKVISMMAGSALLFCVGLRIQPWLVALAIERREVTLGASWRGTSGRVLNMLRGWIVIVLPLYLLHINMQLFIVTFVPMGVATLAFTIVSGIVAMSVGVAYILLNATIFRWAVGEPIPSARPFATEPPDASAFEEARARLAMLLATQRTRQES